MTSLIHPLCLVMFLRSGRNSEYQIYENKYALPLGYTYRQSVSETQTEELNGLEKQVLMLQSVILADSESLGETPINEQLEAIKSMNYEIVSTKGVQWDAGGSR